MSGLCKKYFYQIIQNHFGSDFEIKIENSFFERFLNDSSCMTLVAQENLNKIQFYHDVQVSEKKSDNKLIFYKLQPEVVNETNIRSLVCYSSMPDPLQGFYQSISKVFIPSISKDSFNQKIDPEIYRLIEDLEQRLGSSLKIASGSKEERLIGISCPFDELRYWKELSETSSHLEEQQRASELVDIFSPIKEPLKTNLKDFSFNEMFNLIDDFQDVLDDVWKATDYKPYPEYRMLHLIKLISDQFCRVTRKRITEEFVSIWESEYSHVRDCLQSASSFLTRWLESCEDLTNRIWKQYPSHQWFGAKYVPEDVMEMRDRLQEINNLRTTYQQLAFHLTDSEIKRLNLKQLLSRIFDDFDLFQCTSYTIEKWRELCSRFERQVRPAEDVVADKLRSRLSGGSHKMNQQIDEFRRHQHLIKRHNISKHLTTERENLLVQITNYIKSTANEFKQKLGDSKKLTGRNLPEIVADIIWIKQLEAKVNEAMKTGKLLLQDLNDFNKISQTSHNLLESMIESRDDLFQSWSEQMMTSLDDPNDPVSLQRSSRVMELDHQSGQLTVHYSDRTVYLLREVRQLASLGYRIPSKLQTACAHAQKFYKQAVVLKQVAHLYNTIDQRMIPSQRPLMLTSALEFERIIKSASTSQQKQDSSLIVTWESSSSLDDFISRLQTVAGNLTSQNRKLRQQHSIICDKVAAVMSIDLLRQQQKWKDTLVDIRHVISHVQQTEARGDGTMVRSWRAHWNRQLYKALEYQYQMGLEILTENIPEIKIDLVFRQGKLQFQPTYEEVRARFYREIRRFIAIPTQFRGVTESGDDVAATGQLIFPLMLQRNSKKFFTIFEKAEKLFRRLSEARDQFKDLTILGQVDLLSIITKTCSDFESFHHNFRLLKLKGKEVEKMTSSLKIDCIIVSTLSLKSAVEDQLQKCFDSLLEVLRHRISDYVTSLNEFVTMATTALQKTPQTIDEMTSSRRRFDELRQELMTSRERDLRDLQQLEQLLRKMSGDDVALMTSSMTSLTTRWDTLQLLIDSHSQVLADQKVAMRDAVASRVERFSSEVENFVARWQQMKPSDDDVTLDSGWRDAIEIVDDKRREVNELLVARSNMTEECKQFDDVSAADWSVLDDVILEIDEAVKKWKLLEEFSDQLKVMTSEGWIAFRTRCNLFDDFLMTWETRIRHEQVTMTSALIQNTIDSYKELVPCLKYVRGDHLSSDHWLELFRLIGFARGTTIEKLTFGDLLSASSKIIEKISQLKELNSRAQGEVSIREALRDLELWGVSATFNFTNFKDSSGLNIRLIKDWKDLLNEIGEHQSLLQSLKHSAYYSRFSDKSEIWQNKISELDSNLHLINLIQRKWVYLEPIFGGGALPNEQSRFNRIDADFKSIMSDVSRDGRVMSVVGRAGLHSQLTSISDQLQRCQKSLNEYLEEKRNSFPRFYFIGDEDLLEILGQSTNPQVIQSHLKKLFAGIHAVNFNDNQKSIICIKSSDQEEVLLQTEVQVNSDVEDWLMKLSKQMKTTLEFLLRQFLSNSKNENDHFPCQILCLGQQIQFASNCEEAIERRSLNDLSKALHLQLKSYTSILSEISQISDGHVRGLKLKSLILDIIHNISVVDHLQKSNIRSVNDWSWQKQLRFSATSKAVHIRMVDAEFKYSFEYQGNAAKLVHTPLTDKCYLTLTQAMKSGLGGNPVGPAGTGKTESVKALGSLFGRQVLVFNCDEGIDVRSMNRIFVGLVRCGAWGCFDEFNRLDEQVLSAVATDIQLIQVALRARSTHVHLLGHQVEVDSDSAVFITMNPAGKGYGGRNKLPNNLKQLFRPVAMSKPDNELIAEVILYSEGFSDAHQLSSKLVSVFNLCKELLSHQQHYDWGLRALKTVLRACGHQLHAAGSGDDVNEIEIVVGALRLNTSSKLTFDDSSRFDDLIRDVFPGIDFRDTNEEEMVKMIQEVCDELHLTLRDRQLKKILELREQLRQRTGVVVVGPSGSGKTTLWQVLRLAMTKLQRSVKLHVINPKAILRTQLLGRIDLDTREWFDGVLTNSAREAVKEPLNVNSWIICDGDIDPEWIESLNSVLDDNRLLTMPNGERIKFGTNVNFIFETHDLTFASPATISRMGMIFLSNEDTDITSSLVNKWLQEQAEETRERLQTWIDSYFYKAIDWVMTSPHRIIDCSLVGMGMNALSRLTGCHEQLEFVVALAQGVGGNLTNSACDDLMIEMMKWSGQRLPDSGCPRNVFYNHKAGKLDSYRLKDVSETITIKQLTSLDSLPMIETVEMQRYVDHLMSWLSPSNRQPFIVVGPDGCGKSLLLNYCFDKLTSTQVATIHCSAQTTPTHIIQKLQQSCMSISSTNSVNSGGRMLKPRDCECLILYLKDINLPKPDKWSTSQSVAFLQQLLTYHGFYDDNNEWIGLQSIQIVASFNPATTSGRYKLSTRLTSRVRVLNLEHPTDDDLTVIYTAYLNPVLRHHHVLQRHHVWGSSAYVQNLATSMVQIYQQVRTTFTTDRQPHYIFTPRNLTHWCTSLIRYDDVTLARDDRSTHELLDVWKYEASRIFRDQLVGKDRSKFDSIIDRLLQRDWSMINDDDVTSARCYVTWVAKRNGMLSAMSRDDVTERIEKGVRSFEREIRDLDVPIFDEIIDSIIAMDRVLSSSAGCLLLVGRVGAGRRSCLSLCAHMYRDVDVITPKISQSYNLKNFKNDLKSVIQATGIENKQIIFLLESFQLIDDSFIELINSLLSAGEVPGLYTPEELETLLPSIREEALDAGHRGPLHDYFATKVRTNLHVVVVMDSSDDDFAYNCGRNPALYKRCQLMWMDNWSSSGMRQAARILLKDELTADDNKLVKNFVHIHNKRGQEVGRDNSPGKFISFLQSYKTVLGRKKAQMAEKRTHLQTGLSKLNEAAELVNELKQKAGEQAKLLVEKQSEADTALKDITTAMQEASSQRVEIEDLQQKSSTERTNLDKRKKEIDNQLKHVRPLLLSAQKAVGNISPQNLSEIRVLRNPPEVIRDILEGVLGLMGIYDTTWVSMKSFLAKRGVKDDIINFDARRVTKEVRKSVNQLMTRKSRSFEKQNAQRASTAALPLAEWVVANLKYSEVLEEVAPLQAEQDKLTASLNKVEKRVEKLVSELEQVDHKVTQLRDKFEKRTSEAAQLKAEVDRTQSTIEAAETLVDKLSVEGDRWATQVARLDEQLATLPARCQLASAAINYLSSDIEDDRQLYLQDWMQVTGVEGFDFLALLSNETDQLQWKSEGLPSDLVSLQNALIIFETTKTPMIIDPSSRSIEWLKCHLKKSRVIEVVDQQDESFATNVELAVRFGKTLVVEEVQTIEPILYPLLRGEFISLGPRQVVEVGDKMVDYNEQFRIYLTTRDIAPHIPADISCHIAQINFTTTRAGLQGQLLALTLQHEKPELEKKKLKLLEQSEQLKMKLAELEDSILEQLAQAEGSILDNKQLIYNLNETKSSSLNAEQSLQQFHQMQIELDEQQSIFLPLAEKGSKIFFMICDLHKLNHLYHFPLHFFLQIFEKALEAGIEQNVENRLEELQSRLQRLTFEKVSRALFKTDHLIFALYFSHFISPHLFASKEWEYFTGSVVVDTKNTEVVSWLETDRNEQVSRLKSSLPSLYGLLHLEDTSIWRSFITNAQCENHFPPNVANKLSAFQQVLVVQAIRPDRLESSLWKFVSTCGGLGQVPTTSLRQLYMTGDTSPQRPVLLILQQGADPTHELLELATEVVGADNFTQVAMGQDHQQTTFDLIAEVAHEGGWLCLNNLHLVANWLPALEKEVNSLDAHPNFRLWMTSEARDDLPAALLNFTKLSYETPPGTKQKLMMTYERWASSGSDVINTSSVLRSQMLFALAWMHAVLEERLNFVPHGWSQSYEFTSSDLRAAADVIEQWSGNTIGEVKWSHLCGLLEGAIYGGRVDNLFDLKILKSFLQSCFNVDSFNKGHEGLQVPRPPQSTNIQDYLQVISNLPQIDSPSSLALPANIGRSQQQSAGSRMLEQLRMLSRNPEVISKLDKSKLAAELSPLLLLWKKLVSERDLSEIRDRKRLDDLPRRHKDAVTQFVMLERFSLLSILNQLHRNLSSLSDVIRGRRAMTSEVLETASSLLQQKIPESWKDLWFSSCISTPDSFLQILVVKAAALKKWVEFAEKSKLVVGSQNQLDLSDLLNPKRFISALRVESSRRLSVAVDQLKLVTRWQPSSMSNFHVVIKSLLLEGASFDGSRLHDNKSDSPLLSPSPVCYLSWLPQEQTDVTSQSLSIPVYTDRSRDHLVMSLDVPCPTSSQLSWTQKSPAFLLQ